MMQVAASGGRDVRAASRSDRCLEADRQRLLCENSTLRASELHARSQLSQLERMRCDLSEQMRLERLDAQAVREKGESLRRELQAQRDISDTSQALVESLRGELQALRDNSATSRALLAGDIVEVRATNAALALRASTLETTCSALAAQLDCALRTLRNIRALTADDAAPSATVSAERAARDDVRDGTGLTAVDSRHGSTARTLAALERHGSPSAWNHERELLSPALDASGGMRRDASAGRAVSMRVIDGGNRSTSYVTANAAATTTALADTSAVDPASSLRSAPLDSIKITELQGIVKKVYYGDGECVQARVIWPAYSRSATRSDIFPPLPASCVTRRSIRTGHSRAAAFFPASDKTLPSWWPADGVHVWMKPGGVCRFATTQLTRPQAIQWLAYAVRAKRASDDAAEHFVHNNVFACVHTYEICLQAAKKVGLV